MPLLLVLVLQVTVVSQLGSVEGHAIVVEVTPVSQVESEAVLEVTPVTHIVSVEVKEILLVTAVFSPDHAISIN